MEMGLWIRQCHNSLSRLHMRLSTQARLLKYKYINVHHQVPNTHSRNLLNCVNMRIEVATTKYRHTFTMLQSLDQCGESEWRSEFSELRNQDVRCLSEVELPSTPTWECAEELQARSLLNGGVIPKGN